MNIEALAWPPIKAEDSTALNKFAIFLSSAKNALAGSQYASKFDQPGNIQKLIFKLPFNMRERWRRSADDIMERQLRPVEFNDLVAFMDERPESLRTLSLATSQATLNHSSIQEKENRHSHQWILDHLNRRQRPLPPKLRLISP